MGSFDLFRVEETLAGLRKAKPDIFGAEAHSFRLNPPAPEADVKEFERLHRICLPNEYREFLTHVGNGGAGPFYGVFPLGKVDDNFDLQEFQEEGALVGILSEPFPHQEEWNDLAAMPNENEAEQNEPEYWKRYEAFTDIYWNSSLVNGSIPICHEGCALRIYLVVTGPESGYLWEDRRSEFGGLKPLRLSDASKATFAGWYNGWLNSITTQP